jgi:hypothetical protein
MGEAKPEAEKLPAWQTAGQEALTKAAETKKPLVLFFQAEGDQYGDFYIYGEDYKKLSDESAIFVRIPYTSNRDKSPDGESAVPMSKLLSDNPSRDYGVAVNRPTFIVADWHGNAFNKIERKASANELKTFIDRVPKQMESLNKKLQRNYDSAKASWDKQDHGAALRSINSNFKEDVVGLEPQVSTISLYNTIMDALKAKVEEMASNGDIEGLRGIAKDRYLRGTSVAKEAEDAMNKARPTTQEKKEDSK